MVETVDPISLVDPKYVVNLKGKLHPTYPGVLAAAMANGLREMTVKLIQAPTEANGGLAISEATVVFAGPDGRDRVFTEIGDADAKNTGPLIALHRVRMSATRAKGRALRDALGLGVALAEEMGPDGATAAGMGEVDHPAVPARNQRGANEQLRSAESRGDRAAAAAPPARPAAPAVASVTEFCEECGVQIEGIETKKGPVSVATIVAISEQRWQKALCHACGKARIEMEQANLPQGQIAA